MDSLLGTGTDRAVAEELGVRTHSVTHRRLSLGIPPARPQKHKRFPWREQHVALLGRLPDVEVARRLGLSKVTVGRQRRSRGIPPFVPPKEVFPWTEEQLALLGTRPDTEIAECLDLHPSTVKAKRDRLGILAVRQTRSVRVTPQLRRVLELAVDSKTDLTSPATPRGTNGLAREAVGVAPWHDAPRRFMSYSHQPRSCGNYSGDSKTTHSETASPRKPEQFRRPTSPESV